MALLPYRPLQTWWVRRARPTEQAGCRVLKALLLALSLKAAPFDPLRPVPLSPPACSDATWLLAWPGHCLRYFYPAAEAVCEQGNRGGWRAGEEEEEKVWLRGREKNRQRHDGGHERMRGVSDSDNDGSGDRGGKQKRDKGEEGGRRTQNKQICCSSSLRRDDQASQRGRPASLPPSPGQPPSPGLSL